MKSYVGLLLLIFFYFNFEVFSQSTYHVSPQGSDSNTGGLNDPFLTIQKAIDQSESRDRILIHPGEYSERLTLNRDSLTIEAFNPDEKPVIIGNGSAFDSSVNAVIK